MRHPTDGVLRRALDEPTAVPASDRRHVDTCPECRSRADAVRRDAELTGGWLAEPPGPDLDVEAAWQRLGQVVPAPRPADQARRRAASRRTPLWRRPSAALVAFAVVLGGAGTAAAGGWLRVFQTEQVAAVSISTADLVALPDLSAYGELEVGREPDVREVADAAAAAAQTGLEVPVVADLPRGVSGEPALQVGDRVEATFTFSTDLAARASAQAGEPLPAPPPGLEGSAVRLVAGPGVAQLWQSDSGAPALFVGRAVAPAAFSDGVALDVLRDYLLSLPGLPAGVAEQLRSFTADGSTLPLPIPSDELTSTPVVVDGVPATLLETRDRVLAAVVWVQEGIVTVVAGSLDDEDVLAVAEGLG